MSTKYLKYYCNHLLYYYFVLSPDVISRVQDEAVKSQKSGQVFAVVHIGKDICDSGSEDLLPDAPQAAIKKLNNTATTLIMARLNPPFIK